MTTGQTPDWKRYERQIYLSLIDKAAPGAKITFDEYGSQKLPGRFSKIDRQIDVIVRGQFAGFSGEQTMVVDCKCFSKNVDITTVEAFIGLVEDVGAPFGLLVTTEGFSEAARNRAEGARGMLLDVVPFNELKQWILRAPTIAHTNGTDTASLIWQDANGIHSKIVDPLLADLLSLEMHGLPMRPVP